MEALRQKILQSVVENRAMYTLKVDLLVKYLVSETRSKQNSVYS